MYYRKAHSINYASRIKIGYFVAIKILLQFKLNQLLTKYFFNSSVCIQLFPLLQVISFKY